MDPFAIEDARRRLDRWIEDGQSVLGVVPWLFEENDRLRSAAETSDRECARLRQEIEALRAETNFLIDERGEIGEEAHDLARHGRVLVHVHAQVDAFGTETKGPADGHGGVDAEAARLVGSGRHHAAPARIRAHDDGAAADLRTVALLDGRVERVHVHVDDGPEGGRGAHGRTTRRGRRDRCWGRRR